jgi:hypothetical protein
MKTIQQIVSATAGFCLCAALSAQADNRVNQALSSNAAIASQKDNPFGMPASRGNDGAIVVDATFAHTGNADNEWWQVDLGGLKTIAEVRIWLRSDAIYGLRDSNLRLVIYSDAAYTTVVYSTDLPDGTSVPLPYRSVSHTLPSPVTGWVVRIEHPTGIAEYLQINEVQVFNQAVEEVNLARTGTASQSTTYSTYGPERGIDGVVAGVSGGGTTGSTAHTGGTEDPLLPWWQVDLGAMQPISAVRVFMSADTPQTRNDDLAVVVLDGSLSVVSSNYNAIHPPVVALPGHDFPANKQYLLYTFNPPISGQIIQVAHTATNAQYLVLPEVEVFKAYSSVPSINISQGPTNRTVDLNSSLTLSVAAGVWGANANYLSYQWQSNGVDIVGACGATYTTPLLTALGDYTYGVKLLLPGLTVTTQAVITVFSDVVPPTVVSNSFVARSSLKMTINFSEVLDASTATNVANYVFAGGATVANPVLAPNGKDVTFAVIGLMACDQYVVNVSGIKDLAGNPIVSTNLTGTIPAFQINYALDGTATESSNPFGYPASNAIDGNTGNLMHTGNGDNEWWEVDLGSPSSIGQIALWFRRDCCETRDGNLVIKVLDNPTSRTPVWVGAIGAALPIALNPRTTNFVIAPVVLGQIVTVEHPSGIADYLDFCEVQVMPPASGLCIVSDPVNLTVVTNSPASFSVQVQGPGPIGYLWQHAGTNLPGETSATLFIPQAGAAQAGVYNVVVTNASRQRISAPAVLTLVPPATVYPIVRINFNGSLSGRAYTLAPGEVDVTGTFAALAGSEVVSNGFAILNSANYGEGYSVTNRIVDAGSGVATNFIAEILFIPTAGFEQGTGQYGGYADFFSFGSTWWTEDNHGDGIFALRYFTSTSYEMRVDSVGSGGTVTGDAIPLAGVANHIAMVYRQGLGMTNNFLDYYLNGTLVSMLSLPNNVGSSGVDSVYATFGQAVPGTTYGPCGLDGLVDSLAYSTFSGTFSSTYNFVLYQAPVAPKLGITGPSGGQVTLTWEGSGYVAQENANLANPGGWSDLSGTSPLTVNIGPGSKFFRLRKQ